MSSDPQAARSDPSELNRDHMGEMLDGHLEYLDRMIEDMMGHLEGSSGVDGLLNECMTYLDDLSDGVQDGAELQLGDWKPETAGSSPANVPSGTDEPSAAPTVAVEEAQRPAGGRERQSRPETPDASRAGASRPARKSVEARDTGNADRVSQGSSSAPAARSSEQILQGTLESMDGDRMRLACPYCTRSVRAPVTAAGRKARCPNQGCGMVFRIPRP